MLASETRAFRIVYTHAFASGARVRRSPYFETADPAMIEQLTRSQGAVEIPLRSAAARALALEEAAEASPAPAPAAPIDPAPNWDFMTITALRTWLDSAGIELPTGSPRKSVYSDLCAGAWADGRRPRTFYGLPGGPSPSEGIAFTLTDEAVEAALEAAKVTGEDVPEALLAWLEAPDDELPEESEEESEEEPEEEPEEEDLPFDTTVADPVADPVSEE